SGHGELGGNDQICAGGGEALVGLDDFVEVTLQIANGQIELCETDLHAGGKLFACVRRAISVLRCPLGRGHHRVVLIPLVKSVIGAFHKDLRPLNEGGGEETGESANDDLLEKRGVHRRSNSSDGARAATLCFLRQ